MAQFLSIRKTLLHNRGTLGTLALLVGFVLFFVSPCKVYQIAKKVLLGLFSSTRQKRNGNENVNENVNENGRRMTNVVPPVQQGSSSQSTSTAGQHMAMQLSKNFQNMKHVFKMTCSLSVCVKGAAIACWHYISAFWACLRSNRCTRTTSSSTARRQNCCFATWPPSALTLTCIWLPSWNVMHSKRQFSDSLRSRILE